jgi:hypothetical protein
MRSRGVADRVGRPRRHRSEPGGRPGRAWSVQAPLPGHSTRPQLPVRADGAGAELPLAIWSRVSGGSATALLLRHPRSHAIGAGCPPEDEPVSDKADRLTASSRRVCSVARLACESASARRPVRTRENGLAGRRARVSALGCQLRPATSLVEAATRAAGRSLPDMSLAFALMAAINGSTGSCATLSHGLSLPHQASPASARRPRKILTPQGWRRKGPPETLSRNSSGRGCRCVPLGPVLSV